MVEVEQEWLFGASDVLGCVVDGSAAVVAEPAWGVGCGAFCFEQSPFPVVSAAVLGHVNPTSVRRPMVGVCRCSICRLRVVMGSWHHSCRSCSCSVLECVVYGFDCSDEWCWCGQLPCVQWRAVCVVGDGFGPTVASGAVCADVVVHARPRR